ncbi:MAG TPA: sialidase [Thermoanaerobaculia bacterium]|nr:sialidase [Thermoanaerobaculia bacterium]
MRFSLRFPIALLLLGSALPGVRAAAPSPLTVDEIVAKNVAARGGEEKLKAIHSLRLTGKVTFAFGDNQIEAVFGQVQKRPGMIRQEVTLQGLTAVDAYDGKEGWNLQPFQGRRDAQKHTADENRQLAEQADIEGPLVDWKQKGHTVEYLGTEDIDGTPALKLRVNLKGGNTEYVYLDPDYFLEIRTETITRVRGAEQITDSDLGSYGQIDGAWFPFSIEQSQPGGGGRQRYDVQHAEANVDVEDLLFTFPPAGTPIVLSIKAAPGAPALAASAPPAPAAARPPVFDSGTVSGLGARNIGSAAMSGRIAAIAARNEGGKTTVYVGAASGGVWRSFDGGTTFKPVFDKQPVQSIGAITIDPSHPKTVWVGTGESWMRNSVSVGDGIYKSTDGGETWTNMGLPNSEHIVRVLVDPKRSDTVYACVPGKLWSDSADRGLYKTNDGGKNWSLVLKGANLSTGCSSVTMDPKNPDVLMAGMWDFRRKGWTFRSGGDGPNAPSGSGLFRSEDGGKSWTEMTSRTNAGLPGKPWGRVETVIAPSNPQIVYALIESVHSALYWSGDGGKTWEARDHGQSMIWRPFYFGRLVVDPTNADHVFKPGGSITVSEDGGKSFSYTGGGGHGDWHEIWIDPDNVKHAIAGDDGGLWISEDGGNRWRHSMNLPVSQFYHVALDDRDPYQVYGGIQDNSSWFGDSAHPGGISNSRWTPIPNGDGFWTIPDPSDPDAVYSEAQGGHITRYDRRTGTQRDIQPKAGYKQKLHFNWNAPIYPSPNEKGTIYLGAQYLFRSRDHGLTWDRISPDLTTHDPEKQKQELSGGITVDNSAAEEFTTIYSVSESPKDANVLWVGTSDGNLQLTRDGGKGWTNVVGNVKGLPPAPWVTWVEASRFQPGTAYATFDFHTVGDIRPFAYRTTDFGKTWTRIAGPEQGIRGYAHVIKEDTVKPSLLFLGTEFGLWISVDGGATWAQFKGGDFPDVAVRDLQIHPRDNDLVLATHGRGIWIVDDITPLRSLAADTLGRNAAFLPGRVVQQRMPSNGGWVEGDATFVGPNPTGGAVITYYQRTRHLFGPIKLEILDADGKVIDSIAASKRRGINRVFWSMQVPPPRVPRAAQLAFNSSLGPRVPPGTYTARLTKGGETIEQKFEVAVDRRAPYGPAERKEQFDAVMKAHALFGEMSALNDRIDGARAGVLRAAKGLPDTDALKKRLDAAAGRLDEIKKEIVATKEGGAITGEERIREHLDEVYGALMSWEGKPAAYQVERVEALRRELADVAKEVDAVSKSDLDPINAELGKRKLPPIPTGEAPPGK